ncbi:IS5 family transposase [Methylobacterium ajmalii]|uniref:IS5 family transposase n=1 Tax=Methylobacterium ajmalii TaxID=2738439 RepID=A0ABU9ZRS5_9HYPH
MVAPFMPTNQPGARRKDDRTIMSGILHVIKSACRWKVCPSDYGPSTTVYNRSNRRSRRSFWTRMLEALAKAGWPGEAAALVATYVKTQRAAHGGKRGARTGHRSLAGGSDHQDPRPHPDVIGRPGVIHLTPGNASDVKTAPAVLDKAPGRVRRLIADKGYDADWLRHDLREQGISVIIPGTRARKRKIRLDRRRYRDH